MNDANLVREIQKHWHSLGQSGCKFAQFLSVHPNESSWYKAVVKGNEWRDRSGLVNSEIAQLVDAKVAEPTTNALSIIFPEVVSEQDLCFLLRSLAELPGWTVDVGEPVGVGKRLLIPLGLKVRLNLAGGIDSWVLGFGPLDCLAPTRRSPFTELALEVKAKVFPLRHECMNENPLTAHLADNPAPSLEESAFRDLWSGTKKHKHTFIGGKRSPLAPIARAQVTFAVTRKAWLSSIQ